MQRSIQALSFPYPLCVIPICFGQHDSTVKGHMQTCPHAQSARLLARINQLEERKARKDAKEKAKVQRSEKRETRSSAIRS